MPVRCGLPRPAVWISVADQGRPRMDEPAGGMKMRLILLPKSLPVALAGLMAVMVPPAPAAAQVAAVPQVVKARVNQLVAACAAAGGALGPMTGQGQFVIPRDFTGDGRMDFLVSEGNFPCTGRPTLFRQDGRARVELYVADGAGGAQLVFTDRLLGFRVLDGRPARLQIARTGPACGGAPRCGDELRWNTATRNFLLTPTDGRRGAPAAGSPAMADAGAAPGPVSPPAAAVAAGPAAAPLAVAANARQTFLARCRGETKARYSQMNASAIEGACADGWAKVEAAGPLADAFLAAVPARPGERITLAALRQRLPQLRLTTTRAARANAPDATGRLGALEASVTGTPLIREFTLSWSKLEADPPYDVAGAMAARGARVRALGCYHFGPSEVNRVHIVEAPGRPPFALTTYTRAAALGGQTSWQAVSADLSGQLPTLASLRAANRDPAWNATCPY